MTATLVLHFDWIDGYSAQAPVGVWDAEGASFYPEATAHLKHRGHRAIRPAKRSWDAHIEWLTYTTSAYNANFTVCESEQPLHRVFEAAQKDFLASAPTAQPLALVVGDPAQEPEAVHERPASGGPVEPAARFVLAQSWWLAAELVRRHPELVIQEIHPGDGQYDVLCVSDPRDAEAGERTEVMLNRAGSIQVHRWARGQLENDLVGTWSDVLGSGSPHKFVKSIERAAGFGHPSKAAPSNSRTLAYRLIASLLHAVTIDRHHWDVRNEFVDSSGHVEVNLLGHLGQFPATQEHLLATPRLGLPHEPASHFWIVLRDDRPVAAISIEGRIYRDDSALDLATVYAANGRSMTALLTRVFGGLLP